jgi:hypothetical protein
VPLALFSTYFTSMDIVISEEPSKGANLSLVITTVGQPPVTLKQDCRTEILVGVPPIGGTRSGAARTQDTLVPR